MNEKDAFKKLPRAEQKVRRKLWATSAAMAMVFLALISQSISVELDREYKPSEDPSALLDELGIATVKERAKSGVRAAEVALGYAYLFGKKARQDSAKAAAWFQKAAAQGSPVAAFYLAGLYDAGSGVEQDAKAAFSWYSKAAEAGDPTAQLCIADRYLHGDGVEKNTGLGADWMLKAARSGNTTAMVKFARLVLTQRDGESKKREALEWLNLAAKTDSDGQAELAYLYRDGRITGKNLVESCKWFSVLVRGGHQVYKKPLEELRMQMSPAEISEAERLADAYFGNLEKKK